MLPIITTESTEIDRSQSPNSEYPALHYVDTEKPITDKFGKVVGYEEVKENHDSNVVSHSATTSPKKQHPEEQNQITRSSTPPDPFLLRHHPIISFIFRVFDFTTWFSDLLGNIGFNRQNLNNNNQTRSITTAPQNFPQDDTSKSTDTPPENKKTVTKILRVNRLAQKVQESTQNHQF